MKPEELGAVKKLIEGEQQGGSTLVGLLFVKSGKDSSGWTLVFPEGIAPEFQAHVLECLKIDPAEVQITQTPPIRLEDLVEKEDDDEVEDEDEDEDEDEEEGSEGGNDFHTRFGGDP